MLGVRGAALVADAAANHRDPLIRAFAAIIFDIHINERIRRGDWDHNLSIPRPREEAGIHAPLREEEAGGEESGAGGFALSSEPEAPVPASYKGYRDPDKRRAYMRDLMRKRRAEAKA